MRIKSLLTLGAMILPVMASSTNYFKAGTQWTVNVGPEPSSMRTIVYSLDDGPVSETEEAGALRLVSISEDGEETLEGVILTEEEKVFFWSPTAGWCLLYDFSLQPGEETVLFSGMYTADSNDYPESVVAECDKIVDSYGSLTYKDGVFFLTTSIPQTEAPYSRAIWYNGIGSVQGPLANFENNIDGTYMTLVKVTSGNEVIFDYEKALGIETVIDNRNVSTCEAYRLDGTPDRGQSGIVVSNGKKWIRKTN